MLEIQTWPANAWAARSRCGMIRASLQGRLSRRGCGPGTETRAMVVSHGHFVWYELVTTDVAAAIAFYTRVMGWGAWDASTPGRPYILFGDGKSAISALTPLPDD